MLYRREGIKLVRPLERHVKTTAVHQCPKDNSLQGPEQRQPCTMKLGRDYAMPCTAQCDKEVCSFCSRLSLMHNTWPCRCVATVGSPCRTVSSELLCTNQRAECRVGEEQIHMCS